MARKRKSDDAESSGLDPIVKEAKDRFARCEDAESEFRKLFVEDMKFANGDPDNNWQWPDRIRQSRDGDARPCLTINKVRQHNLQIINDAKQNKPSIKTLPVDGQADIQIAKILDGIMRHVEYNSHAEIAYDTATEFAVQGGLGYWRVITDYAHDGSFEQEIFIRRVKDPLSVVIDCDIQSADGADAKFGFVFEDVPKEEYEAQYPDEDPASVTFPMSATGDPWLDKDHVRVCEYFRRAEKKDMLINHPVKGPMKLSAVDDADERKSLLADGNVKKREIVEPHFEWYKIAGDKIIDRKEWPGRYLPIVRVVGEEIVINGKVERKGHTRGMKDAARMYNYMTSANVEYIALQTKTPYIAPAEAIEGYEDEWANANKDNKAYLPYNSVDEHGNQIPRPQREQPPVGASAYLQAMQTAQQELMMASGQYQEQFGAPSNADAGVAIAARQRQGDKATYHFIDNVARAIRYTGRIMVDLIPKIYDTQRVVRIVGEDGSEDFAQINPEQPHAVGDANGQPAPIQPQGSQKPTAAEAAQLIYNPGIGRYDVTVEVGPNYETRRQEAFHALTQIMSQDQDLMKVAGDLLFKAADFPMADEVAERLHRTIPPQILGEGPSPEMQDATQKMQHMGQMIEHLSQQLQQALADKNIEQVNASIKAYDSETKRMQALGPVDPALVSHLATQVVMQMMQEGSPEGMVAPQMQPPQLPPPQAAPQTQPNPPSAGFSLPAPQGQ
jgi:hypothetical protein